MIKVDIICPGFFKFPWFVKTMPKIGDVIDGGLYRVINRAVFEKPLDPEYSYTISAGTLIVEYLG